MDEVRVLRWVARHCRSPGSIVGPKTLPRLLRPTPVTGNCFIIEKAAAFRGVRDLADGVLEGEPMAYRR